MRLPTTLPWRRLYVLLVTFAAQSVIAQGPASCGFHLDVFANLTSTHAAVADMPGAPGNTIGYPFPAPGNPYRAHATPGSTVTISLSVPAGTLGPLPLGAPSPVTIFWSVGAVNIPAALAPVFVQPCAGPGTPAIISILPAIGGAIVDGCGLVGPPPIIPPVDPGFPNKFEVIVGYPPAAAALGPITLQAVVCLPGGALALSNGVCLFPGPSPAEATLVPALLPCGATVPTDDGQAPMPTPPLFAFYGIPTPLCEVDTNGYIDFLPGPGTGGGCDLAGTSGDFGCPAASVTARPRIDANHADLDLAVPPPPPLVNDLTMEIAPAFPFWPTRHIVRWKNVMTFGAAAGTANQRSMTVELWDDSRIVVTRDRAANTVTVAMHDQVGIGPGLAAHGYGGPPPAGPTCAAIAGIPFAPLYGTPGFVGIPFGVIHMDLLASSVAFSSLAAVFAPLGAGLPIYTLTVY